LGKASAKWLPADHYLLMGSGTYFLARSAIGSGLSEKKIILTENASNSDIFETITELAGKSAVVVGIGNAKGQGLSLARFFRNRSTMNDASPKEKL
jgi:hypothetical protein